MEEAKVRQPWKALPCVNDFMKALEHQSKMIGEKLKKAANDEGSAIGMEIHLHL
jgi:hypothetical protein